MTELALPIAFARGLWGGSLTLAIGVLKDASSTRMASPHLFAVLATGVTFLVGMLAFWRAWQWAGSPDPVHRLTSRAFGVATGWTVPAIVSFHAIYFGWISRSQTALNDAFTRLIELAWR